MWTTCFHLYPKIKVEPFLSLFPLCIFSFFVNRGGKEGLFNLIKIDWNSKESGRGNKKRDQVRLGVREKVKEKRYKDVKVKEREF